MTIERDDPEEAKPLTEDELRLAEWACNVAGGALLRDGLAPWLIATIVQEALEDYARWGRPAKSPRRFLVRRILAKARLRRKLRGIRPPANPEARAHLLHVVRTQAALAPLSPASRKALEMLFHEHRNYEEIAGTLGLSVEDVRRLVSRALERLHKWRPAAAEE